jgi:hypothetical protein
VTPRSEGSGTHRFVARLFAEPIVRFALLGGVAFFAYRHFVPDTEAEEVTIRVDRSAVNAIEADRSVRDAAIDAYILDEVLFREAKARGLDDGDAIVRRRLIEKMRLLLEAETTIAAPTDAELDAYLREHAARFSRPLRIAFEHRFFARSRRGAAAEPDSGRALVELRAGRDAPGDPFLLGRALPLSSRGQIANAFGTPFVERIEALRAGAWEGPIASGYGSHVVRVIAREEAALPHLDDVRERVLGEWREDATDRAIEERIRELGRRYTVIREGDR